MGWKAGTEVKREAMRGQSVVFPGGRRSARMKGYKHVVVDTNAWFRSFSLDSEADVTPMFAVSTFFWGSLFRDLKGAETVTFTFDDYDKASEMRLRFYSREREKKADRAPRPDEYLCPITERLFAWSDRPLESDRIDEIRPDKMPFGCRWSRVWNNKAAKIRLWEVIVECIKSIVRSGAKTNPNTEYIIHDLHGDLWTYPEGVPGSEADMPIPIEYGEGDFKTILWALYYSRMSVNTLLVTIDWDIALTMMLYKTAIDILISRCYVHRDDLRLSEFTFDYNEVGLTMATAKAKFGSARESAFEILRMPEFVDAIPSYDRRMVYVMACLGFKGVDYCDGLNRFGFSEAVYRKFFEKCLVLPRWLETYFRPSEPLRRCVRFYPGRYLDFLRYGSPRKADRGPEALVEFTKEVLDMLYVVTYGALFDCVRKPGGPPPIPYHDLFGSASDLDEALCDSTLEYDVFEIEETHPVSRLAYPAHAGYPPAQARAIEAKYGASVYTPL